MSLDMMIFTTVKELAERKEKSVVSQLVNLYNDGQATEIVLVSGVAKISALRGIVSELAQEAQQRQASEERLREGIKNV